MNLERLKKLNIKIETLDDLIKVMDVILPGHSIDEDNEAQLIIYTGLHNVAAGGDEPILMDTESCFACGKGKFE